MWWLMADTAGRSGDYRADSHMCYRQYRASGLTKTIFSFNKYQLSVPFKCTISFYLSQGLSFPDSSDSAVNQANVFLCSCSRLKTLLPPPSYIQAAICR
jgi:hypothetical protein